MSLTVAFRPGPLSHATAAYRQGDLALECTLLRPDHPDTLSAAIDRRLAVKRPTTVVVADTLSLTFSGHEATLVSIDAYTNSARWIQRDDLEAVDVIDVGDIRLLTHEAGSDRVDLGVVPTFLFAPAERRLRIELGGPAQSYYQVAECVFVGVDAGDMLMALELRPLQRAD